MKITILILLGLIIIHTNSLAKEKKDCNNIKKFDPRYLACKISNLTSKKDGVTLDTTNVKEKKYIIDWFKKKK
jgi:hypothetical protein|tara:strand:+ start:168 stop:386 length:219 start_codon:yes stop_codon:yes gene_type:complete